jgi:RNA polymerase sigma factor (sigma-70 family)
VSSSTDSRRFDALYRATRRDVLSYLVRRAGDPEHAADLLAETYLIAWRRLHDIPPAPQDRLWLFGVARNLLKKHALRRRSDDALIQSLAHELQLDPRIATRPPIEDDRTDALRNGLRRLPKKEREIMLLTAWEGFTPREIATITGSSANAVRVRLSRARSKLRAGLDDPRRGSILGALTSTDQ